MNRAIVTTLVALAVIGAAAAGFLALKKSKARGSVVVRLRLGVSPKEQADLVAAQANSARFKYEIGKKAGVKPALAQRLVAKVVPRTALVEAEVRVQTADQGRRYADSFLENLQAQCGNVARLSLVDQSVR